MSDRPRPVVLCILDGVGLGEGGEDDAVATAATPHLDHLLASCPHLRLAAHGLAVGLPSDADMGNSEVGHNAMGAGRVFDQGASLVNAAFESGAIFHTDTWRALVACPTLHLIGLVSDGNVHSHISHLLALIDAAAAAGVRRIRVHALTDGRDVAARSALTWLVPLEEHLADLDGVDAQIASGGGRMVITMDRYEADWPMVARGWAVHVRGEGRTFPSAVEAVTTLYDEDPEVDDQRLPPFVIAEDGVPVGPIRDGDGVLLFNFRGDRAIEITRAFEDEHFTGFARGLRPQVTFAGMMQYDGDLRLPKRFLVAPPLIQGTVSDVLAAADLRTFACSETQKFGHVTYFFNGNRSGRPDTEDWREILSDVRPFDEVPWMKAAEITDAVIEALRTGSYAHLRLNYANGDMVGHTGHLQATRLAVEVVDLQLARLTRAVHDVGGVMIVTADHGNADEMWQRGGRGVVARGPNGEPLPRTSHTLHPVPCILYDPHGHRALDTTLVRPGISSVGGTILDLLGLPVPADWSPTLLAKETP